MSPCFFRGECKQRRKQFAERVEDFVHGCLRGTPAGRIWRIAIHPIFSDVDVEAAQIDCAELVERVINLVELERLISRAAISDHLIESLQNPAIDKRCCSGGLWT